MKVSTVEAIKANLNGIDGNILYLFDIDNTIITTNTNFGYNIDKLKVVRQYHNDKQYINHLISKWRMSREILLTDDQWPEFLQSIDRPYALTKMDAGRLGEIASIEKWRNNELSNIKIQFNAIYPIDNTVYTQPKDIGIEDATFFNGIFYTGNATKGSIVKQILSSNLYDLVMFVDDRVEQLQDVMYSCAEAGVRYLPMQFIIKKEHYKKQSLAEIEAEAKIIEFLNVNL